MKRLAATAAAVILSATMPALAADSVAPVSPPTHYLIDLSVDQLNTLFAVFPAAEMAQNKWLPTSDAIKNQVLKQQADAQKALEDYNKAHAAPTKGK